MADSPTMPALSPSEALYSEVSVHLKDFLGKHSIPNLVKVTKGQYRNIGVAKSVCRELYLHSIRTCPKVLAVGVKIKDSKKSSKKAIITSDQKYALPISYQGWWELLSEDGKAIRPIATVAELARIFPAKALVREPIKALVSKEGTSDLSQDRSRMLHSGEQLTLAGDNVVTVSTGKNSVSRRMLRCFDPKGESVYLGLDQKGLFSPIAGSGNISGVHTIHSLVGRFRLPVLVRLVHGIIPMRLERNSFTGVFRLLGIYDDETAFVMPLRKDAKMVPISTREPLKFSPASNFELIENSDECAHYQQRCGRMIASYLNSIHVLVNPPDIASVHKSNGESKTVETEVKSTGPANSSGKQEVDYIYDELDDIYDYIREGGAPPPPRPRPPNQAARVDRRVSSSVVQTKPISPVIREYEDYFGVSPPGNAVEKRRRSSNSKGNMSPDMEHRHSDENYWEEPIYDEIEKFQRRIQQGQKHIASESMNVLARQRTPDEKYVPHQGSPDAVRGEDIKPGNNWLEEVARRAPHNDTDSPVQNLRQIYKNKESDSSSDSRPNSLEKSLENLAGNDLEPEANAPPLPPKRYELEEEQAESPPKSKSLPRPISKIIDPDPPTKSLPKDLSMMFGKKAKSPKSRPAPEPLKITAKTQAEKSREQQSPKVMELKNSPLSETKKVPEAKKVSETKKVMETKSPRQTEMKSKAVEAKKKDKKDAEVKKKEDFYPAKKGAEVHYGMPNKGKSSPIGVPIPVVEHGGRRHSHTSITSSPPHNYLWPAPRRHSVVPSATSRGTSVAVTLGTISPGVPMDARSIVSGSGASVKVRSNSSSAVHNVSAYPRSPGTAPGTHTQRIALTPMNAHMGHTQPQYVAVAQVGSDKPGSNDKSNGTVGGPQRHIQSVHL